MPRCQPGKGRSRANLINIEKNDGEQWRHLRKAPDRVVGRISRQWFKVRDTYGVEVEPGEDAALIIAIAVSIDRLRE